jgi:hypothetical protein
VIIYFDKLFEKKGMGYYQKRLIINTNKIVEKSVEFFINYADAL